MPSPSVQANRLGLAETHCGACRRVIHPATSPVGLRSSPSGDANQEVDEEEGADGPDRPEQLVEVGVDERDGAERHRDAGGGRAWCSFTTAALQLLAVDDDVTVGLGATWWSRWPRVSSLVVGDEVGACDVVDGPVDEALQEAHESVDVGEVGRHADGDPDRRDLPVVFPATVRRAARRTSPDRPGRTTAPSRAVRARARSRRRPGCRSSRCAARCSPGWRAPRSGRSSIDAPVAVAHEERDGAAAAIGRRRAVDLDDGAAVAVAEAEQRVEQPAR